MLRLFTRLHENIDDVEKRIEKFHYKKKKKEKRIVQCERHNGIGIYQWLIIVVSMILLTKGL